ncbi:MAG: hypothetical protein HDS23_02510 [Bacteroides sp.]|nr:hypothetical protein [Bacteroides sp.]
MKKLPLIIIGTAVVAIGGSMMAFGSSEASKLTAEMSLPKVMHKPSARKNVKQQAARKTAGFDTWIVDVKSNFDTNSQFTPTEGKVYEYSAEVSITGNKAKLKGLFDLWYDDIEKEYTLEGSYDQRSGEIRIPVGKYDSEIQGIDSYTKAAEMYSLSTNEPYTLIVFAGDMTDSGQLNTIDELVFSVSDDMDRITAKTGFGLYAFNTKGETMAFYDYYKSCDLSTPVNGVKLSTNTGTLDFAGLFICTGMPQHASLSILNRGSQSTTMRCETSSADITIDNDESTIASGERKTFDLTLTPSQTGHINENIYFRTPDGDDLAVNVDVDVYERPDYTLITKNGAEYMDFEFSPLYPFIIEERDGKKVAVSINQGSMTEGWFTMTVNIPEGKVGTLIYDATQMDKQPNGFVCSLDKEIVADFRYVSSSYAPFPVGGTLIIPEGKHIVGFSHEIQIDWFEDTNRHGEVYVSSIDLQVTDATPNSAVVDNTQITFDDAWFDSISTSRQASVNLHNTGTEALRVTGFDATDGFSALIPDLSVQHGGYITVPLVWTVDKVGKAEGSVTLHTTAGDFSINCEGSAKAIPEDFHNIVSAGKISFDTDANYPFVYNAARGYLYNSTSKADIEEISNSWLDVTFEVPEGSIGKLDWDAYNDSEDPFVFMGIPSVVSGSIFTIDGDNEKAIGGVGIHCSASSMYTPGELLFRPGRHSVRFNYKKTGSRPKDVYGDDRLKLYEISLELINNEEYKGYVTPETCDFKGIEYTVERDGHQMIGLVNYTDTPVELISWEHDGPFSIVDLSDFAYEGATPFMVEYHPTKTGVETGSITLHTTIGDYKVDCSAKGIDLNRGGRVFYESFEYGSEGWLLEDFDGDQVNWMDLSDIINNYESLTMGIPYGYRAMGTVFFEYGNNRWFESPVNNVIFSPEIEIPANGDTFLQFITAAKSFNNDTLEVLVGVDADTYIDEYESLLTLNFEDLTLWREYQANLTKYAGKTIRIAFRSKTEKATNAYYIMIDDILVTNSETPRVSGVTEIAPEKAELTDTEWYTPEGIRLSKPQQGLNIVVERWSDGSVTSRKSIIRNH